MKAGYLALFSLVIACMSVPAAAAVRVVEDDKECIGPQSETRLYITVTDIREAKGWITVTLYGDDRRKFLVRNGSLYLGRITAKSPSTRLCLYIPKPAYYAVAIYHDENADTRIDRGFMGIPTEGIGFSNNAATFLSMPSFKGARMRVNGDAGEIVIRMKYP